MGCADDLDIEECNFLFEYASGIVNCGYPNPGETGCPRCITGSTCDPAHNVLERIEASKKALRALMSLDLKGPHKYSTRGGGNRGDGVCGDLDECCSEFGWCGSTAEFCSRS